MAVRELRKESETSHQVASLRREYATMNQDESHLRLLSVLHYVLAVLSALFSSFFLIHVVWGISIWRGVSFFPGPPPGGPPPPFGGSPLPFGLMIMFMGGAAVLAGWSFAACLIVAGRSLAARRHYMFCLVVAAVACVACNPIGIGLGVFTFIALLRPSVKELFGVP